MVQLSLVLCYVVLLWCSSCSFYTSQSCRGAALVRFVIHSVAVVQFSLVFHFTMLLWWSSCSSCNLQCSWGASLVRFEIHNVAVVRILPMFTSGHILNVSKPCFYAETMWICETHLQIGIALIVLWIAMLLWCGSCSFCDLQHCCGAAPARFIIHNVVLVKLLIVL